MQNIDWMIWVDKHIATWVNDEQMMINVKCTDDDNNNAVAANDAADDDV